MILSSRSVSCRFASITCLVISILIVNLLKTNTLCAQEFTPEMLEEASKQTGLSKDELIRRYQQDQNEPADATADENAGVPGRRQLDGIDDSRPSSASEPFRDTNAEVILPYSQVADPEKILAELIATAVGDTTSRHFFGADFFRLDTGVFAPPSFGPISSDHRLGVGDEIVINVWGGIDLQLVRIVDRDGSIILPRVGKIACAGRTLHEVDRSIRDRLSQSHSSIDTGDGGEGDTFVEVTLGHLRAIRVFVVGQAMRPGSYEMSSVSTVLTALYAASGPSELGTFRDIKIVRGGETIGSFDLYTYLQGGSRAQDITLHEGDTVFIGDREVSVEITSGVRRPMFYEMKTNEDLTDLIRYSGGFNALAAPEVIHISRILPPALRSSGQPDQVFLDVDLDVESLRSRDGNPVRLFDGDVVRIDEIGDRLENWVEVKGSVKRPGRYEFRSGMTVTDLLASAEGLWPDALTERAVIDQIGRAHV